jgi:VWFA-related protein
MRGTRSIGRSVAGLGLAAVLLAVTPLHDVALRGQAQQTPPPPPAGTSQTPQNPQQPPTFRARIDSISVDVIVTDRQGNPVPELTADDFEIREAGKPQKIDTFKHIVQDDSQDASPPRELQSFEDQRRETAKDNNRLYVIFLDDYHVRKGNSLRIRQELASWVSRLAPRDLVAIMYPLLPAAAITFSRNHDGTAVELMAFEGRKYDYTPKNPLEARFQMMSPEYQELMRNEATFSALESVCAYLGSLRDGRKTVLLVSEGMSSSVPAGVRTRGAITSQPTTTGMNNTLAATADLFSQMRDLFVEAARANTAIYTLDPRGLAPSEFGIDDNVDSNADRNILNESMDTLRSIAGETDGRAIVGRNNPIPELERMRRDNSQYYLMSYTSSIAPRDGKFHPIDVRLKTRKGLEIRARKGYWAYSAADIERASAPPKPLPPRDVSDALEDLAVVTTSGARKPAAHFLSAVRGGAQDAIVTYVWESTAPMSTPAADIPDRVTIIAHSIQGDVLFKGPVPKTDGLLPAGGRVSFDAPAGSVRVQTVTENARGSRLDSDTVVLDIPAFKSEDLTVSTPVVFRGRTVRDLQLVRANPSPVPAATRAFSRSERLLLRFEIYGPSDPAPTVTMRLLNNQGNSMAAFPAPVRTPAGAYESEFGLSAFPPGEYLIEISLSAGSKTARKLLGIRVTS